MSDDGKALGTAEDGQHGCSRKVKKLSVQCQAARSQSTYNSVSPIRSLFISCRKGNRNITYASWRLRKCPMLGNTWRKIYCISVAWLLISHQEVILTNESLHSWIAQFQTLAKRFACMPCWSSRIQLFSSQAKWCFSMLSIHSIPTSWASWSMIYQLKIFWLLDIMSTTITELDSSGRVQHSGCSILESP